MSTIYTLLSTDLINDTFDDINTNFANLNTDKAEDSAVVHDTGNETIAGVKTFSSPLITNWAINFNAPEWFLINWKIVPSVTGGNLTVAIKTLAGTDPSATDPVYVRIGDVVRSITSALSVVANSWTSYLNLGSAELATKETDLFPYLQWNTTTSAVNILASRIPYAWTMADFNNSNTNEKWAIGIINYNSTNSVVNIWRFAATLSAGAGYTWSVPTFTSSNLIQRPIYMNAPKDFVPTITAWTSSWVSSVYAKYEVNWRKIHCEWQINISTPQTTINTVTITLPFTSQNQIAFATYLIDNSVDVSSTWFVNFASMSFRKIGNFTWFLVIRYSADYVI